MVNVMIGLYFELKGATGGEYVIGLYYELKGATSGEYCDRS